MAGETQDITVLELLDRIESGQLTGIHDLAATVLDGVQRMVDSILARSEPRTSLSDRFSWTGSPLADQLGAKYETEERLALSYFESQNQRALSRLAQAVSPIDMMSGYSFFDFEGLVFTNAEDWDVVEEGFVDELVYQEASKKRSLFGQDIRRQATLSPEGDLSFEKELVRHPAQSDQGRRRSGPVSRDTRRAKSPARPTTVRPSPVRRPTPMKPAMRVRKPIVSSPYPEAMATSADMGLSPILERAIEMVEAAQSLSRTSQPEVFEFENIALGADPLQTAEMPFEQPSSTWGPTQRSGSPRPVTEGHRIDDIRLKPQGMPALSGALDTVEGLKSRLFETQEQSLTQTLDFRPLRSPLLMEPDLNLDMALVEPGQEESFIGAESAQGPEASASAGRAVSESLFQPPAQKPAAPVKKSWSMKDLVRSAGLSREAAKTSALGSPITAARLSPQQEIAQSEQGSPSAILSQPVSVDGSGTPVQSFVGPVAAAEVAVAESFEPIALSPGEQGASGERIARTSMGLRPVVPLSPMAVSAEDVKAGFVPVQDVFIPASAAPALAVGMAEARGAAGLKTSGISSISKMSEARVDRMMASEILSPLGERFSSEPTVSEMGLATEDFSFVVPTAFDAFVESSPLEGSTQPTRREPSLKEIVESRVSIREEAPLQAPVEHQIIARRSLGSRLPLSLQGGSEDLSDTPTADSGLRPQGNEIPFKGLGQDWSASAPESIRARAELAGWTLDGFDKLLDAPEGATLLREGVTQGTGFWQRLEERGFLEGPVSEREALDASMVQLGSEEPILQGETESQQEGAPPEREWNKEKLRSVLSRAAAKSGVAANPLVPRLAKEVSARNEFSDSKLFGSSLLDIWASTPASSQPESIGRFAESLRRELQAEGVADGALLNIPAEISGAAQVRPAVEAPVVARADDGASFSASEGEGAQGLGMDFRASSAMSADTPGSGSRPRYETAARLTRQLSRMLQSLFRGSAHGMPLAGLRWENGPATQTLDSMVDKMLATPSGQVLLSRGAELSESSNMDVEHSDTIFLQPWLEDAFREVISKERRVASRGEDRFERPGVAMGMSVGRVMARQGAVSARLRALMTGGSADAKASSSTLDEIYGWGDLSHVALGDDGTAGDLESGRREEGAVSSLPKVSPSSNAVSAGSSAVPLGLPPSGTSMDMGRLSHVMLRSSTAAPADFNLVSPVTMAVAETAQLKPKDEPIGDTPLRTSRESEASGGTEESKEIPSEIVDVLSYEIASRISYRMKFEQDRSGRWD